MFDMVYCHSKGAAKTRRLVLHQEDLDPPFIIETRMGINMEGRDVIW